MAYLEIKTIKGRKYKYERTSYRTGNQIKHKSKYIGPVETSEKIQRTRVGRKPKLKIRTLTKEESDYLEKNLRSSQSFIKDRAKIISLSNQDKTVKQIAEKLGFHRPKIEKIIKKFNEIGLDIFNRKYSPGKPRRITKEERALILQYFNSSPLKIGLHFNNWSLNNLANYVNKNGITISSSQLRRIIKTDNISYKKKIPWLYSDDPDFAKKNLL